MLRDRVLQTIHLTSNKRLSTQLQYVLLPIKMDEAFAQRSEGCELESYLLCGVISDLNKNKHKIGTHENVCVCQIRMTK